MRRNDSKAVLIILSAYPNMSLIQAQRAIRDHGAAEHFLAWAKRELAEGNQLYAYMESIWALKLCPAGYVHYPGHLVTVDDPKWAFKLLVCVG